MSASEINVAPAATDAPPATDAPSNENESYVTKADFDKAMQRINGQSSALGKMTGDMERISSAISELKPASITDTEGAQKSTEYQALQSEVNAMKEQTARARQANLRGSIKNQLLEHGADADLADIAVDAVLSREKSNFVLSDDDLGNLDISYRGHDEIEIGLGEWAQSYIASDRGQKLLPQKRSPMGNGSATHLGGVESVTLVSNREMGRLSKDQLASGNYQWDGKR